tara:strand:+ start:365 stop:556 length:192 start_codon:yes stop_codon:yes gene_type:complete
VDSNHHKAWRIVLEYSRNQIKATLLYKLVCDDEKVDGQDKCWDESIALLDKGSWEVRRSLILN